ncbi:MAG: hypothetical protein ABIH37_00495 [archaeon]
MKIFEHPRYPMVMFLAITIVLLLIVFSFANVINANKETIQKNNYKKLEKQLWENSLENKKIQEETNEQEIKSGISGFVAEEDNQTNKNLKYSVKSYLIYYVIITLLIAGIYIITTKISKRKN